MLAAAIEVHRHLGPGLLESAYGTALQRELWLRGIPFRAEVKLPLVYKGCRIGSGYRADLIVDDRVLVELKAVDALSAIHQAQTLTYLRLLGLEVGLLINFNTDLLHRGVRRLIHSAGLSASSVPLRSSEARKCSGAGQAADPMPR